ncbi:Methyltransferase domain-containing protein [Salinibacillus kushneri]|uniref:Methyltransferase domain-containing protein n=1 Tax=Salinibacillus kushneri TaxID=237682 RepID=A0A1I0G3U2_9BACI|nr:class I SAM-dependent methyltransferase [Salinibacillus kushneri]SET65408.1 Methyltransferase domain-containing protein [Salinibacillus kushneri]
MSYQKFAQVYDQLMSEAPYDLWVHFTLEMIKQHRPDAKSILDIGCGTGEISLRLNTIGFDVTGVDLSEDMLAMAQNKNTNVTWVKQDIRSLETPVPYDVAISFCDVINYIVEEEDIIASFNKVYWQLNDDGLFMFDVHSENYVHEVLADQTFAEVRDDVSYIWFCDQGDFPSSVEHDLTFFIKNEHNDYARYDEYHVQRTFPIEFYKRTAEKAGFKVLGIYSDFFTDRLDNQGDRIFFVCSK